MEKIHPNKSLFSRLMYAARDFRSRELFLAVDRYGNGDVLDIGGWDFFLSLQGRNVDYASWTIVENDQSKITHLSNPKVKVVYGDGCALDFGDETFDCVLSIQVLEHVFDPIKMVREMARVLKPGGTAIILVPQTSNLHLVPHHYYNFTIFWIREAMKSVNLRIIEEKRLGGSWSTIASKLLYLVLQGAGCKGFVLSEKKSFAFYLLFPLMVVYALINIPICLLFSLGDLARIRIIISLS